MERRWERRETLDPGLIWFRKGECYFNLGEYGNALLCYSYARLNGYGKGLHSPESSQINAAILKCNDKLCEAPKQCIIATAAYGSPMAPEVQYLRMIRDTNIRATPVGNKWMDTFERVYYSFSPTVAKMMFRNKGLKRLIRVSIVKPIVSAIQILMKLFKKKPHLSQNIKI